MNSQIGCNVYYLFNGQEVELSATMALMKVHIVGQLRSPAAAGNFLARRNDAIPYTIYHSNGDDYMQYNVHKYDEESKLALAETISGPSWTR